MAEQSVIAPKKVFSRIGFALVLFIAVSYAAEILAVLALHFFFPEYNYGMTVSLIISAFSMYALGVPAFYLVVKGHKPIKKAVGSARFSTLAVLFCITMFFMYSGSIVGGFVYGFLGEKLGIYLKEGTLDIIGELPFGVAFIFTVLVAPIFEELVFRRLIIDRVGVYGEKLAIFFSALLFAFFHMSVQQFFYAFLAGLVFGYLYMRTGRIRYSVVLHASVNFFGSCIPLLLTRYAGYEEFALAETPEQMLGVAESNPIGYVFVLAYSIALLALMFGGLVLFVLYRKRFRFEAAAMQLPKDSEGTVAFTGLGVIIFIAVSVILPFVLSII